jgi:hypothetical protein
MQEQTTTLVVRPAARGGKYLGHDAANSNNHSALVAALDLATGQVVAYGLAEAPSPESAGPRNLMEPVSRAAPFATDANTVQVRLSVAISEPTVFRVLVFGPLKHPDQARLAQADITVLPGLNVGTTAAYPEGLVIEVPGLCIGNVSADWQGPQLSCTAQVTMMCGCPISNKPDWPWPVGDFAVNLVTYMASGAVYQYPLHFDTTSGLISTFTGSWASQAQAGDAVTQVWVYAAEAKLGNQGSFQVYPTRALSLPLPAELREVVY